MKKLVVNADDFGYREGINKGIIYAHQNGVVTSASMFVEREGTADAIRLAKENPAIGLGIHIDLDRFFEVDHHAGLILGWLDDHHDISEVQSEIHRQLEKYFSFGFPCDHVDSHHHAHLHPEVFPLVCREASTFKVPIVRFSEKNSFDHSKVNEMKRAIKENGLISPDHFIEGWYWGNVDEPYQFAELMTHPGYGELWREAELAHCCQPPLKQYLIDQKIDLLRFSDIAAGNR